jgi:hypothetical protein
MPDYSMPPTAPLAECSQVWLYVLTMCRGIMASLTSIMFTGWYKYKGSDADMIALAQYLDKVEADTRALAEKLSRWTPPKQP